MAALYLVWYLPKVATHFKFLIVPCKVRGCGWTIEGLREESVSVGSYDEEDDRWWDTIAMKM